MPERSVFERREREHGPSVVVALLSGAVASLPFQKNAPGFLILCALVPFLLLLRSLGRGREPLAGFRTGWFFGFGFFLGLLYWIGLLSQTEIPVRALALGGLFILSAYLALFPALFGLLYGALKGRLPVLLFAPVVWGATEHLRSLGTLGFPWGSLGYALMDHLFLVQLARFASVDVLTVLVVAVNVLVAESIIHASNRNLRPFAIRFAAALLVLFLVALEGVRAIRRGYEPSGKPVRVAVVQPNILAEEKWTEAYKDGSIRILADITRSAAAAEPGLGLVVWPETAVPVYVRQEHRYFKQLFDLVDEIRVPILFGFPDAEYAVGMGYEYFNAAMLLDAGGHVRGEYRKMHLVPFGERLPLHDRLDFVGHLNLGEADFSPGTDPAVFGNGETEFSANICFEAIFPPLCRRFVREGARFLVNLTNDAWFGTTSAPYQHAAMARLRCVELGVFLARSANTGISLIADPVGRVVDSLGLYEKGYVAADIVPTAAGTFYARHGDWLPRLELALSGAFVVFALLRGRRAGSKKRG
ncbi:MAG: apolipoprotein N-acyltransferase [Candidatus Eisenbacteria bacterium]